MSCVKANLQCLLVTITCTHHFKSFIGGKVPKRQAVSVGAMAVTALSSQGHDWACSLQTGQRWRPRNGTLWWWWWWRLSALSQQWTQVKTSFLCCCGPTCFSFFFLKRRFLFVSRYGPPVRTEHRLIVENLSSRISWQVRFLYYLSKSTPLSFF